MIFPRGGDRTPDRLPDYEVASRGESREMSVNIVRPSEEVFLRSASVALESSAVYTDGLQGYVFAMLGGIVLFYFVIDRQFYFSLWN